MEQPFIESNIEEVSRESFPPSIDLDSVQSSERVEVPKEETVNNVQTKLPVDTNASKGQEETPISGIPEFNLVMRNTPEDKEYWNRQSGKSVNFGETADEFLNKTVLNPIATAVFGSMSPQLTRDELKDFGMSKAQKDSIVATTGGDPKSYTDEEFYSAVYPIDEEMFGLSRDNLREASEIEGDFNKQSIMSVQQTLVDAGYDLGKTGINGDGVDGDKGAKTRAAIKDYQLKQSIASVDAVPSDFSNGSVSQSTNVTIDTRIKNLQTELGVAVDGQVGSQTINTFMGNYGTEDEAIAAWDEIFLGENATERTSENNYTLTTSQQNVMTQLNEEFPELQATSGYRNPIHNAKTSIENMFGSGVTRASAKETYSSTYDPIIDEYYDAKESKDSEAMQTYKDEAYQLLLTAGGSHVTGSAMDLRSNDLTDDRKTEVISRLNELGYNAKLENEGLPNEHIHIQGVADKFD